MPKTSWKSCLVVLGIVSCLLGTMHAQTNQSNTALLVFAGTASGTPTTGNLSSATVSTSNMDGSWTINGSSSQFQYDSVAAMHFASSITLTGGGTYSGSSSYGLDFTTGPSGAWYYSPEAPPTTDNWSFGQWTSTTLPQNDTEGTAYSMGEIGGWSESLQQVDYVDIAIIPSGSALLPECEVAEEGDNPITGPNGSQIVMSTNAWYVFMTRYYENGESMQCMVLDATRLLIGVGGHTPYTSGVNAINFYYGPSGDEPETTGSHIYMGSTIMDAAGDWPAPGFSPTAAAPTYNNGSGTYLSSVTVAISDITPNPSGAQNELIEYCMDLTNTCTPSTPYSSPIIITTTGTYLRSVASGAGWNNSAITSAQYTITPWLGPAWVQSYSSLAQGGIGSCYDTPACMTNTQTSVTNDAIAVLVVWDGATTSVSSVTDNCGTSNGGSDSYTLLGGHTGNTSSNDALYYALVGYGKSCTITATVNESTVSNLAVVAVEVNNVDQTAPIYPGNYALSNNVDAPKSATNAVTSGNLQAPTNQPNSLETAMFLEEISSLETISAGTGFVLQSDGWNGSADMDYGVELTDLPDAGVSSPGTFTVSLGTGYTETAAVAWQAAPPTSIVTLSSSLNPSTYDAQITFTAAVPSAATGTITFYDGSTAISSAVTIAGGSATYSTAALAVGSHTITASYSGDSNYPAATSNSLTQTVSKATPTVSTWPTASAITYGQTLASSTLSGGTASVGGTFGFTTPATAPGVGTAPQSVTFTPTNATDYTTVIGSVSVTVNQAGPSGTTASTTTLSISPSNVTAGTAGPVVMTATVVPTSGSGTPTGTTTFFNGSTEIGTGALSGGVATFDYDPNSLSAGKYSITASYSGDGTFAGSSSPAQTLTVKATYSMSATAVTVSSGASGTSTVTVSSTKDYAGTVTLTCSVTSSPKGATDLPTCSSPDYS